MMNALVYAMLRWHADCRRFGAMFDHTGDTYANGASSYLPDMGVLAVYMYASGSPFETVMSKYVE